MSGWVGLWGGVVAISDASPGEMRHQGTIGWEPLRRHQGLAQGTDVSPQADYAAILAKTARWLGAFTP